MVLLFSASEAGGLETGKAEEGGGQKVKMSAWIFLLRGLERGLFQV